MTARAAHAGSATAEALRAYAAAGLGVVTFAASLNAAGEATAQGGRSAADRMCPERRRVNSALGRAGSGGPVSGRRLTSAVAYCSIGRMTAQRRLVSRDHIDFGRVWSAACCA